MTRDVTASPATPAAASTPATASAPAIRPPLALVADDEEAPRQHLMQALREVWPALRIVEAASGVDAWDSFLEQEPALCFLDVRMPGMTGIEVAQRIDGQAHLVFVCTPTDHALQTFESAAIAHLRKPLDPAHLAALVATLRPRLAQPPQDLHEALERLVGRVRRPAPLSVISGGEPDDLQVLPTEDVLYFETDARLTRVVHRRGEMLMRTPIKELLVLLDGARFPQIHRSVIVNQRFVAGTQRAADGSLRVTLLDRPETLPVAHQFRALFSRP